MIRFRYLDGVKRTLAMPSKRMGVFDEREPGLKVQVYVLLSINTDQTELTKYAYNPI